MWRYLFAYGTIKLKSYIVGSLDDVCFPLIICGAPNIKLTIKSKLYRYNVMKLKYQIRFQLRTLQMAFIYRLNFFFVLGNGFWGFKYLLKTNPKKKKQHLRFLI
jgi:hypothetical protein